MFNKSFNAELESALKIPSSKEICEAVTKYSKDSGEELRFESMEKPVTFYLDSHLYEAKIKAERGGFIIRCVEKK